MKFKPRVLDLSKISFSMINQYLRCPRQFMYHYVQGKSEPPGIALIEGSAHHAALEYNNHHKRKHGRDLRDSVITEKFVEELRTKVKEDKVKYEEESENALIERGGIWHKKYMREFAPTIEPDMVEEEFNKEVELNGRPTIVHGYIDLGYSRRVADYKTTSSYGFSQKKRAIDHDLQLSFYSWATGRSKVEQICLIKGNIPEVKNIQSTRSEGQLRYALRIAEQVMDAVERGAFPMCSPDQWNCSKLYCGFYSQCRGKIEGVANYGNNARLCGIKNYKKGYGNSGGGERTSHYRKPSDSLPGGF